MAEGTGLAVPVEVAEKEAAATAAAATAVGMVVPQAVAKVVADTRAAAAREAVEVASVNANGQWGRRGLQ